MQFETKMASASSRSAFEPKPGRKYDVFISFRGEDTRHNFTSHLHAALKRASLEAYLDDEKLEKGDEISPSLIQAIRDSSISLIVFSQNYAFSKWCLDELVHIIKLKKEKDQFVIPIFYNIDPSQVRNETGPYMEALAQHEKRHDHEKVTGWKAALVEPANLCGRHCIQTIT